jgi:hypothetical protein
MDGCWRAATVSTPWELLAVLLLWCPVYVVVRWGGLNLHFHYSEEGRLGGRPIR